MGMGNRDDHRILDRVAALERLDNDEAFLGELAGIFLKDYPRMMREIERGVLTRNAPALRHAAHGLKGSVKEFAAHDAADAAFRLEQMAMTGDLRLVEDAWANLKVEMARLLPALQDLAHR